MERKKVYRLYFYAVTMPKRKFDSPIWECYTRNEDTGNCICNYCPKTYKLSTAENSHSSLWYHVKNKHPNKTPKPDQPASKKGKEAGTTRQVPIASYLQQKKSQERLYAELICLDGLSFNQAANSDFVRSSMQLRGFTPYRSHDTVKAKVLQS